MNKIKIGLVGIGRAGWGMHCKALEARSDKFEIVACCDIDESRLKKMQERFPTVTCYSTIEDLVADEAIDLVDIATPSTLHADHAITALKAGKTVFLEKPIATSLADAKRIIAVAEETGTKIYFRHNRRFETPFQHIREIIASGKLGDVYEIYLHRQGYQRRQDWQTLTSCGGGQLNNWGPHIIDHSLQFLESPVQDIWSDLKLIAAVGDAEDHLKIVFKGKNGRLVDMQISGGVALGQPTYIVHGSKGSLVCKGSSIELKYLDPFDTLTPIAAISDSPPLEGGFGNDEKLRWIKESFEADPKLKVRTEDIWDYLYDTLTTGAEFPIKTEEALKVMEVIDTVKAGTKFASPSSAQA
jgi:predicted dehydrogenase